jgi:signal peptidase I
VPDLATRKLRRRISKTGFWFLITILVLSAAIITFFFTSRVSLFSVVGDSMEPTFQPRDSFVLRQSSAPEQGQIIIFRKPAAWKYTSGMDEQLVKRVGAIPGDTLTFDGAAFKVNGEVLYDVAAAGYECAAGARDYSHTLTASETFVIGDNAPRSLDSRRIFCDGSPGDSYVERRQVIDFGTMLFKF